MRESENKGELQQAAAQYRTFVDLMDDSVFTVDRDLRYLLINSRYRTLHGLPENYTGKNYGDLNPEEDTAVFREKVGEVIGTKKTLQYETSRGGRLYLDKLSPVIDPANGRVRAVTVISMDITERRQLAAERKEQERLITDIFSAIKDGISVVDPSLTIQRTNKTMEQWFQPSMPLVGKKCFEIHNRSEPCDSCPVLRTLGSGKPDREIITKKDGDTITGWVEIFSYPMFRPETGEITSVIEHLCDITEQKSIEYTYEREMEFYTEELRRYAETLSSTNLKLNLMNNVTRHDILNSVTGLLGSVEMIISGVSKEQEMKFLNDIRTLSKTVQRQIEFTRQYQDIGVRAPEWFDIRPMITVASEQLPLESVTVTSNVDGHEIYADPLIGKVFYNLMENSLSRHGETVSKMSFDLERSGSNMMVVFSDDGVGVPEQMNDKIFLQGFGKHTGLGMYLAQAILSITDIGIRETGEPGNGVRFEMIIPAGAYREKGSSG